MARRPQRYTIYDMMEQKGLFDTNPANTYARNVDNQSIYAGPVPYPKMFYHPKGETRVIVRATMEMTPFGPELRGEQREIIWAIADDEIMEKELRAKGWHDHPEDALRAAEGLAPLPKAARPKSLEELRRENATLQAELEKLREAGGA